VRDRIYLSECAWEAARAVRTTEYKYIETYDPGVYERAPQELYRMSDDPGETHNLIDTYPEIATALAEDLRRWTRQWGENDPMQPILEHGLPFVRRMDQILREVGLSWADWKQNPRRTRYDQALRRFKGQPTPSQSAAAYR
jgi:hypothetical protein